MNNNSHHTARRGSDDLLIDQARIIKILGSLPMLSTPRSFRLTPEMARVRPPMPIWTTWLSRASAVFALIFIFILSARLITPPSAMMAAEWQADSVAEMMPAEEVAPMMAPAEEFEMDAAPAAAEAPLAQEIAPKEAPQADAPEGEEPALSAAPPAIGMGGGGATEDNSTQPAEEIAPLAATMDEQSAEQMPEASSAIVEQPEDSGAVVERTAPEELPMDLPEYSTDVGTPDPLLWSLWITGALSTLLLSGMLIYKNLYTRGWRDRWNNKLDHEK